MSFVKYKVSLWSADGSTFIRPINLAVPVAIADGGGASLSWVSDNGTGFNRVFDSVVEGGAHTWLPSSQVTILGNPLYPSPPVLQCSVAFGLVVTDARALTNGNDARLVFNNGSFIYLHANNKSDNGTCFDFYYCLEGTETPMSSYVARVTNDSTFAYAGAQSIPMPIFNEDGSFTDWSLRGIYYIFGGGIGSYKIFLANHLWVANANSMEDWYNGIVPVDENEPYPDMPESEPSGPSTGTGIPTSDPVDFPSLPTFSATDTGFITLFNPTLSQVKALADYMWNGLFDVNNLRKIFADPMDCILGFNMLPVAIPNLGPADVCIGNLVSSVSMNVASSQWVEVDCGQLDLGLPYGSYLDFSPYTKYAIYLPYIGTCDLSADDVAGKVLQLKYHVDVLSCSCVAYLKCGDSVLYQWTGSCGYSIPVTQNDFSRMIMAIVSMAAGAIGGAITAGGGMASVAGFARGGAESAAKNVMGLKPEVHRSGSVGSSAGLMGGQTPYLILEVPKACKPAKQYHYLGYPSFTTVKLGDVSGRQDFESVILDGIPCTEEERDMIAAACEGGIYL